MHMCVPLEHAYALLYNVVQMLNLFPIGNLEKGDIGSSSAYLFFLRFIYFKERDPL